MTENLPDPKSRKETYLAKAAGMTVEELPTPESREELYLNAIAEGGGGGGTSDFNDLTNRPKYNGTTMDGDTNIPEVVSYTAGDGIDITNAVISATNTGKARVLTADDYNYHSSGSTDNGIAPWKLESGIYVMAPGLKIYYQKGDSVTTTDWVTSTILIVSAWKATETKYGANYLVSKRSSTGDDYNTIAFYRYTYNNGGEAKSSVELYQSANSLTSTSTTAPLSANQGRVLNNKIGGDLSNLTTTDKTSLINAINEVAGQGGGITELTTADYNYPTDNPTKIAAWLLDEGFYMSDVPVYVNSSTPRFGFFIVYSSTTNTCVINYAVGNGTATMYEYSNGMMIHSYELIPPTVVQSTGTSTTDVMSQNAVTSMVYADPSQKTKISLGNTAQVNGVRAVAIGAYSNAAQNGAIALGAGASTSAIGEMNIGSNSTSYGYNNSNYRLLTGLYDGQSAHDGVNVSQVNSVIDAINTALSTNIPHIGA